MAPQYFSAVWDYFILLGTERAKCLLCEKCYSRKGRSTTSLKNHLRSMHNNQYKEMINSKNESEEKLKTTIPLEVKNSNVKQITKSRFEGAKVSEVNPNSLDYRICEMLIVDDLPVSHVQNLGFLRLMAKTTPLYRVKSCQFYSNVIYHVIYKSVAKEILKIVYSIKECKVSFTVDSWFNRTVGVSLLILTCHAINNEFERTNLVLSVETLQGENLNCEYISEKFDAMIMKWGLRNDDVHCVMRVAGADDAALCISGAHNIDYNLHTLQSIVLSGLASQKGLSAIISKCRTIANHFTNLTAAEDLKKIQDSMQLPQLEVIQDEPTSWRSTLYMLQRMHSLKETLHLYAAKAEISLLNNTEWKVFLDCVNLLKPFDEIKDRMSETTSSISHVIPFTTSLNKSLQCIDDGLVVNEKNDSEEGVRSMKEKLQTELADRLAILESSEMYTIATLLDPKYKLDYFSSQRVKDHVQLTIARLHDEVTEAAEEQSLKRKRDEFSQNNSTGTGSSFEFSATDHLEVLLSTNSDEDDEALDKRKSITNIENYLNEERLDENSDSLSWWKEKQKEYPMLSRLARQYLACPSNSVSSEQLNYPKVFYDEKKNRRKLDEVEKLLFLKCNLPIIKFKYK
uniref:Zinc finger BED domain-containing protein 4-like n=1 Tax=Hirondellea gigas TaxID=1518452 RepID=A0A6A7G8N7_9CRUS